MLGDSAEDRMAKTGAKWLNEQSIHVMAMSPDKKDYGHHNYPLERFGKAIAFMKAQGCEKLGVVGASTTGMMLLLSGAVTDDCDLAPGLCDGRLLPRRQGRRYRETRR